MIKVTLFLYMYFWSLGLQQHAIFGSIEVPLDAGDMFCELVHLFSILLWACQIILL